MAIAPLPPWLNVSPEHFMDAVKSGGAMGMGFAQAQNHNAEIEAELAQRATANQMRQQELLGAQGFKAWELEQTLRQHAADTAAQREQAANALEESERYHTDLVAANRERYKGLYNLGEDKLDFNYDKLDSQDQNTGKPMFFPEFPGVGFIRQPSGALTKVSSAAHMTPGQMAALERGAISAARPTSNETVNMPSYKARQSAYADLLKKYSQPNAFSGPPPLAGGNTNGIPLNTIPASLTMPAPGARVAPPLAGPGQGTMPGAGAAPGLDAGPAVSAPSIDPRQFYNVTPGSRGDQPALTKDKAREFLTQARGDRKLAEQYATEAGYTF